MKERSEMACIQIGLEESLLEFEKERDARTETLQLIMDALMDDRLELDEKRFKVEQDSATLDREERKSLVAVLRTLAWNL